LEHLYSNGAPILVEGRIFSDGTYILLFWDAYTLMARLKLHGTHKSLWDACPKVEPYLIPCNNTIFTSPCLSSQ